MTGYHTPQTEPDFLAATQIGVGKHLLIVTAVLYWRDCGWWMANWWRCTNVCSVCRLSVIQRFHCKWLQSAVEELTLSQQVKTFHAFHAFRTFIAAFTTAPPPLPVLCHNNPINVTSYLLRIHFNIFLPFNTRSSKLHLSDRFPHLNIVYISP
jgi:hypothetical protein